jgi:hypothetical protein
VTSRTLGAIYRVPALLAVASLVGLVAALVGDGPWDLLSWLGLGAAVAAGAWPALRRRAPAASPPPAPPGPPCS